MKFKRHKEYGLADQAAGRCPYCLASAEMDCNCAKEEKSKSALQKTNHELGYELEAIAAVLEFRGITDEAETLRVVAARLK